jgi:hypothetical protein
VADLLQDAVGDPHEHSRVRPRLFRSEDDADLAVAELFFRVNEQPEAPRVAVRAQAAIFHREPAPADVAPDFGDGAVRDERNRPPLSRYCGR